MQGNVLGQSGGGLKIDELIKEYKVASGGNVSAGDFVKFVEEYNIGTDTQLNDTSNSGDVISAVALSSNKVFIAYCIGLAHLLYGTVCTINGNTITVGNATSIGIRGLGENISSVALSSSKVFISYSYTTKSGSELYGLVCTVSGTTITSGTATQLKTDNFSNYVISAVAISSTKVFIAHSVANYYGMGVTVCTISGTSIAISSYKQIDNRMHSGDVISAVALSSNKVFIAHNYSDNNNYYYLHGVICVLNENSINEGVDVNALIYNTTNVAKVISVVALSDSKVFIAHSYGDNNNLYGLVCTVSGTTITSGSDTQLSTAVKSGTKLSTTLILDNKVLITHSYTNYNNLYGVVCTIKGTIMAVRYRYTIKF